MIRRTMIATLVLLTTSSVFGVDLLFTVVVPLEFQGINANITNVSVTCELKGFPPSTLVNGERVYSPGTGPTVAKKSVLVPLAQNSTAPTSSTSLAVGGFNKDYAKISFTDYDLAGYDPRLVESALCYFALRGGDGAMYSPTGVAPGSGSNFSLFPGGFVPLEQYAYAWPAMFQPYRPSQNPIPSTPQTYLYRWQTWYYLGAIPF